MRPTALVVSTFALLALIVAGCGGSSEHSHAWSLYVIDHDGLEPDGEDDLALRPYRRALATIREGCTYEAEDDLGDSAVAVSDQLLADTGRRWTMLAVLQATAEVVTAPAIRESPPEECTALFALAALFLKGQSP